jgi:hypothetical protein
MLCHLLMFPASLFVVFQIDQNFVVVFVAKFLHVNVGITYWDVGLHIFIQERASLSKVCKLPLLNSKP